MGGMVINSVSAWLIFLLLYLMISQIFVTIQNLELLNFNLVNENNNNNK
jgi:hypothetical protein